MSLALFLLQVFGISISGAVAPGPVGATAVAEGMQNKYAGTFIALGHLVIELPLMVAVTAGLGTFMQNQILQFVTLCIGTAVMYWMAIGLTQATKSQNVAQKAITKYGPFKAGLVLSATNPYFLLWWVTVGLNLTTQLKSYALWAFPLFTLAHWLADLGWFQLLSWASFRGTELMGTKSHKIVLSVCAAAMYVFASIFLFQVVRLFLAF